MGGADTLLKLSGIPNPCQYDIHPLKDSCVAKSNDPKPMLDQPCIASRVLRLSEIMDASIDLDHQPLRQTHEINDIGPDRSLSPEP